MKFFNKIITISKLFHIGFSDNHIWNVRVGEKRHRVQDVLNNYEELIGTTRSEVIQFFRKYELIKKDSDKWIYEIKKNKKGDYIIILHFYQDNLIKVNYSYLEYK